MLRCRPVRSPLRISNRPRRSGQSVLPAERPTAVTVVQEPGRAYSPVPRRNATSPEGHHRTSGPQLDAKPEPHRQPHKLSLFPKPDPRFTSSSATQAAILPSGGRSTERVKPESLYPRSQTESPTLQALWSPTPMIQRIGMPSRRNEGGASVCYQLLNGDTLLRGEIPI